MSTSDFLCLSLLQLELIDMFGLFSPLLAGPSRLFARGFSSTPIAQKIKTHSGAKKRFALTGSGVVS